MKKKLIIVGASVMAIMAFSNGAAFGEQCGHTHVVRTGDTLSGIARQTLGSSRRWRSIYNANYNVVGANPTFIFPGQKLVIPCGKVAKRTTKIKAKPVSAPPPKEVTKETGIVAKKPAAKTSSPDLAGLQVVRFLTGGDYKPFTDQALPQGGMITQIVRDALASEAKTTGGPAARVSFVNDWAAHLDPLLVNNAFDMGFPWFRPNCERYDALDKPARFRCDRFYFSKPVFEILVLFFKKRDSDFSFADDKSVYGKRICRPSGYFTFDLDKDGRNWVKDKKVTLVRPQSVDACFEMLAKGEVDAVSLNEFTGRAAVRKLKLSEKVEAIEKPVSILSLHVVVSKTHARAKPLLAYINRALERLRAGGDYGSIVDKHLTRFWGESETQ